MLAQSEEEEENNKETTAVAAASSPTTTTTTTTTVNRKYRQYLIDRANGQSRIGSSSSSSSSSSRPPCCMCYVPKPVVWWADYIEQNAWFERMGAVGWYDPDNHKARKLWIGLGLLANVFAFGLSLYVCLAIATNSYDLLKATAFTRGYVTSMTPALYPYRHELYKGLKATAIYTTLLVSPYSNNAPLPDDWKGPVERVVLSEDYCDLSDIVVARPICQACEDVSQRLVSTLFISLVMTIPSITTSVLRLYPHYDCNCQKVFGSFAALISVAFAIYTFMVYQFKCFRVIGFGNTYCVDVENDVAYPIDRNESCADWAKIETSFFAGPGWICLAVACGMKILDMLFQLAIPTPTICRDHDEQRLYEEQHFLLQHANGGDDNAVQDDGAEAD